MHNELHRVRRASLGLITWTLLTGAAAEAQDTSAFVWQNATELTWVSTGGNASSSTLGLKAALTGTAAANTFKFDLGGVRGETTLRSLTATGTPSSFSVNETNDSELTAESYFARLRYDRSLGFAFTFGGAGWDRNTFAGVQNRYAVVAGVGKTWTETENGRFKTDIGATYTIQKDVDPAPGSDDAFGGIRLSFDAMRRLSESADFTSTLVVNENLEDTGDVRADWVNSLAVSMSERLALKTSLQLLYDRQPSLLGVPLFDGGGVPTGSNVLTPGDEVDSILTLALVITL